MDEIYSNGSTILCGVDEKQGNLQQTSMPVVDPRFPRRVWEIERDANVKVEGNLSSCPISPKTTRKLNGGVGWYSVRPESANEHVPHSCWIW